MDIDYRPWSPGPVRGHRWKFWLAGFALLLVLCVAVPAGLVVRWFVRATIEAGEGYPSPTLAVQAYFLTTPVGGPLAGDEVEGNLFCDGREEVLHRQALDLVTAAKRAEMPGLIAFDKAREHPSAGDELIDGDQAVYATKVQWSYSNVNPDRKPSSWTWWLSAHQDRTFRLFDDGGWRVCEVEAPDPCDEASLIACDRRLTPAVSAKPD